MLERPVLPGIHPRHHRKAPKIQLNRFRKFNRIASIVVPVALRIDRADLLERVRAAAAEVVEAALKAANIETLRPAPKRHTARKTAIAVAALTVTGAAATAVYMWSKRHDQLRATDTSYGDDYATGMAAASAPVGGSFSPDLEPPPPPVAPVPSSPEPRNGHPVAGPPTMHSTVARTSAPGARFAIPSGAADGQPRPRGPVSAALGGEQKLPIGGEGSWYVTNEREQPRDPQRDSPRDPEREQVRDPKGIPAQPSPELEPHPASDMPQDPGQSPRP